MRELSVLQSYRYFIVPTAFLVTLIGCSVDGLWNICAAILTFLGCIGVASMLFESERMYKKRLTDFQTRTTECPNVFSVLLGTLRVVARSVVPQDPEMIDTTDRKSSKMSD